MANPRGQQRDKPYRDALRRAIARAEQDDAMHKLDRIADQHLKAAAGGDVSALKELADRLDGKVAQAIIGDDEADPIRLETIRRIIVKPGHSDGGGVPPAADPGPV